MNVTIDKTVRITVEVGNDTWQEELSDGHTMEVIEVVQRWYDTGSTAVPSGAVQVVGLRRKQDGSLGRTRVSKVYATAEEIRTLPAHVLTQLAWAEPEVHLHRYEDGASRRTTERVLPDDPPEQPHL